MNLHKKSSNSFSAFPKPSNRSQLSKISHHRYATSSPYSNITKTPSKDLQNIQVPKVPPIQLVPKSRIHFQLSPSKSKYDLKALSINQDLQSIQKVLNRKKTDKKASDVEAHLKSFHIQSTRNLIQTKIDSLKAPPSQPAESEIFFKAVKSRNIEKTQEMLTSNKSLVNSFDSTRQTALHWACRRGYTEIVKLLVTHKASFTAVDMVGRSAEDIARSKEYYEIIDYFNSTKKMIQLASQNKI